MNGLTGQSTFVVTRGGQALQHLGVATVRALVDAILDSRIDGTIIDYDIKGKEKKLGTLFASVYFGECLGEWVN